MDLSASDTALISINAQLLVRSGVREGTVWPLRFDQVTTIGRAAANHLVIPDEICSRHHCEVFCDEGTWKLRDLRSLNGTRVNGEPIIGDVVLSEGKQFQIGNTTAILKLSTAPTPLVTCHQPPIPCRLMIVLGKKRSDWCGWV